MLGVIIIVIILLFVLNRAYVHRKKILTYFIEDTRGAKAIRGTKEVHGESFVTKYIFSTDHKMIARQYMFTGIFWAVIGGLLSLLIRLQLGMPEMDLNWLEPVLGR